MGATERVLLARAKVNLHLDVYGRLPSGYHAIGTLFHSIALADRLHVRRVASGVHLECETPGVPVDGRNLVARAARAFFRFTGIDGGVAVRIEKQIPVGGGLGGGSTDAAATLVALNALYGTHYPTAVLERIGAVIGADVPFCVRGGCAWGWGTGTLLERLPVLGRCPVLLVNPGLSIETGWAYRALAMPPAPPDFGLTARREGVKIHRDWVCALSQKRCAGVDPSMRNVFERVVFQAHPVIAEIRDRLRRFGAIARMSGTGATVFGVFREREVADRAADALRRHYPFVVATELADKGVEFVPARERTKT